MDADIIIVAPDERRGMDLQPLLDCKKAGYPVIQYLTFVENEIRRIDLKRMELGWLVYSDGFTFGNMDRFLKRTFDLVVSSVHPVADGAAAVGRDDCDPTGGAGAGALSAGTGDTGRPRVPDHEAADLAVAQAQGAVQLVAAKGQPHHYCRRAAATGTDR